MLNSVSFAARKDLYEKPNMDAPQAYPRADRGPLVNHPPKAEKANNHKVAKTIAKLVATAAVAVGAVALGSKMGWFKPETIKKLIPDAALKWDKAAVLKEPVKKGLAAVEKFGTTIADYATTKSAAVVDFFKNIIPKKSA